MASSITFDEADVLRTVRDFLEHSGHVEPMHALEKSASIAPQDVSDEMQFLRELVLDGRWKEVRDFAEVLAETKHRAVYEECRYHVARQQYLEALQGPPPDLARALRYLEELKSTKPPGAEAACAELERLLPAESPSKGGVSYMQREFERYGGRLRCFRGMFSALLPVLCPGQTESSSAPPSEPLPPPLSQDRLCVLLLKGRLYEQCENACRERSGGRGLPAGVLHLGSWIERLPDHVFGRELFTTISVIVNPHLPSATSTTSESTCCPAPLPTVDPKHPSRNDGCQVLHSRDLSGCTGTPKIPKVSSVTPASACALRFENDFVQSKMATPTCAPLDRYTSSTPKHHPIPSTPPPASSPVPYVPGTHGLHDTPHLSHHTTVTSEGAIREWPSLTQRGVVTDTQVVRAVAFSHTGELVAVGSNSKILRILSTKLLLSHTSSGEQSPLTLLKAHHKGSIYCLAWFQDRILASGSNDQTIKLIEHGTDPLQVRRLLVHNGTVRDLSFLEDGYLISGGTGDYDVKLSQCSSLQCVHSFAGHLEEVMAICPLESTLVASGSMDRTIRLWDTRQRSQAGTLVLSSGVTSLSSFQTQLAAATLCGRCQVHDLRTMRLLSSVKPHTDECRSVGYSPDGRWLLTGSYDGQVSLVNTLSTQWKVIHAEKDKVIQCRWHFSPELFAVTGAEKRASFWGLQW